jgi:hypothetical protein
MARERPTEADLTRQQRDFEELEALEGRLRLTQARLRSLLSSRRLLIERITRWDERFSRDGDDAPRRH